MIEALLFGELLSVVGIYCFVCPSYPEAHYISILRLSLWQCNKSGSYSLNSAWCRQCSLHHVDVETVEKSFLSAHAEFPVFCIRQSVCDPWVKFVFNLSYFGDRISGRSNVKKHFDVSTSRFDFLVISWCKVCAEPLGQVVPDCLLLSCGACKFCLNNQV